MVWLFTCIGFMVCWFTFYWIYGLLVYFLMDLWSAGLLFIGFMACWFTLYWIYGLLVYFFNGIMVCWFTFYWINGLLVYLLLDLWLFLDLWPVCLLLIWFMVCWFTCYWIYGLLVYFLLDLLTAGSCWNFKKKIGGLYYALKNVYNPLSIVSWIPYDIYAFY